jgi:hypothetical protein
MSDFESGVPVREMSLPSSLLSSCLSATSRSEENTRSAYTQFSREFDLLLACINGADFEAIRQLIRRGLDWQTLLRIAEHHRLIPQVYSSLCEVADLVPSEGLERLRRRYEANVRQTLRLSRDLIRVLDHFECRGIHALAYKGPTLSSMLHGDISQRQFVDVDLLVHPSDVQNTKTALIELGYIIGEAFTPRQEKSYIVSGYEYVFDLPDARNVLELKWRILPGFYTIDFDVASFFDRSVTIEVGGRLMRTLCPEDLLLVLCVHAAKHAWVELSFLSDISQLIRSQPIKWDQVLEQASQLGIRRIAAVNLLLVQNLLGKTSPVSLRKQEEALAGALLTRIAQSRDVDTESVSYFRFMLDLRERSRDRVRFLWRLISTPSIGEWETVRLPTQLFALYYLVRVYRLLGRVSSYLQRGGKRRREGPDFQPGRVCTQSNVRHG